MDAPTTLLQLSDFTKNMLPFAGVLLIVISLMMMLRKRRRKAHMTPTPMEKVERYNQEKRVRDDLEAVMVEVEQLARRFSAQLDAKTMHLEKLLDEADQKIAMLQADAPKETAPPQAEPKQTPPAAPTEKDELSRRVCELADVGMGADEIARELDEHVGKVELILALRQ